MTPRRVPLACLPTPLVPAPRLAEILGSGPLWIKRDDLTGFAMAGNKARALEFLLGDALGNGCDVLVAAGSVSSNFCAAAAVAARRCGLDCELLLSESASAAGSTNVAIARAVGALTASSTLLRLARLSRRPLGPRGRAPSGGSAALPTAARWGDTHRCGRLRLCRPRRSPSKAPRSGIQPDIVVVATGSGATQAGLVAGQAGYGLPWHVIGASVSRPIGGSDGTGAGIGEGRALRNSASRIRTPTTWTFVICAAAASA